MFGHLGVTAEATDIGDWETFEGEAFTDSPVGVTRLRFRCRNGMWLQLAGTALTAMGEEDATAPAFTIRPA